MKWLLVKIKRVLNYLKNYRRVPCPCSDLKQKPEKKDEKSLKKGEFTLLAPQ